jgi:cysteine-rich repeat protein
MSLVDLAVMLVFVSVLLWTVNEVCHRRTRTQTVRLNPSLRRNRIAVLLLGLLVISGAGAHRASAVVIDFEQFLPGTVVNSIQLDPGVTIYVANGNPAHPDTAIIFDSSCEGGCTGGDHDLRTPGQGIGNTLAQGRVLVIATDDVDVDPTDGLVDDPDDEVAGGTILLAFTHAFSVESMRVIDIDLNETQGFVELTLAAGGTTRQPLVALGNNSGQTVIFPGAPLATAIEVFFESSGAIDDIVINDTVGGGPECGDGTIDAGEECEPPNTASCDPFCQMSDDTGPKCGNGIPEEGVICDDGNLISGDGCETDCTVVDGGGDRDCPNQIEICNDFVDDDGDNLID